MAVAWTYTKSTNLAVVTGGTSGTPATIATAITADRAGSVTLKAAAAPSLTFTLTYQITPVELRALIISFVIASKTTQTDYIGITGTDAWDAAQTEVINVSAGNGTYPSTKRFRTITNICCTDSATGAGGTVWADGTLAVTQPQWGVFWDWSEVNAVRVDCKLQVGDGSTATYFWEKDRIICIGPGVITADNQSFVALKENATMQHGVVLDETNKLVSQPCVFSGLAVPYVFSFINSSWTSTTAIQQHYGTVAFAGKDNNTAYRGSFNLDNSGAHRFWHNQINMASVNGATATTDIFNLKVLNMLGIMSPTSGATISDVNVISAPFGLYLHEPNALATNINLYGCTLVFTISYNVSGTVYFINVNQYPLDAVGEFQDLWLGDGSVEYPYATGGHYHLGIVGNMVEFAWDATAATVQTGLEGVFGVGMVTVTDYDYPGYPDAWSLGIQFDTSIGDSNLVADTTSLTGGGWYDIEYLVAYKPFGSWIVNFNTAATGIAYRQYYFDLNVCDKDGNPLSGVTVDAEDQYATACWTAGTITTDADGDIAQQRISHEKYTAGASDTSPTVVTYSPIKVTVSKSGYKTLVLDEIMMYENKKWHVELQPYEGAAQSRVVSIGVM